MAEHSNGKRQFAEFAHFKGCFSLRPRKAPIIEVLTDETAADRVLKVQLAGIYPVIWCRVLTLATAAEMPTTSVVLRQDEAPSLLWLSVQTGALYISERQVADHTCTAAGASYCKS